MADNSQFRLRAGDIKSKAQTISHPWDDKSQITGVMMARAVGLERTDVSFARIAPGKESFVYHSHYYEEEWVYIRSGKAVAEINGKEFEVGPGRLHGLSHAFGRASLAQRGNGGSRLSEGRRESRSRSRGFSQAWRTHVSPRDRDRYFRHRRRQTIRTALAPRRIYPRFASTDRKYANMAVT
jgi:uncharacterized cupin superfamily protein